MDGRLHAPEDPQPCEAASSRLRGAVLALAAAWLWLLLFAGNGGHGFDLSCWQAWSAGIATHGLGGAYATPNLDYLPRGSSGRLRG
jgi:hypothetical protein